jgi:hypothetical protein
VWPCGCSRGAMEKPYGAQAPAEWRRRRGGPSGSRIWGRCAAPRRPSPRRARLRCLYESTAFSLLSLSLREREGKVRRAQSWAATGWGGGEPLRTCVWTHKGGKVSVRQFGHLGRPFAPGYSWTLRRVRSLNLNSQSV